MNREDFEKAVNEMVEKCKYTLITKGREYQNNKDEKSVNVFNNFERVGDRLGVSRELALMIYLTKHFDSLCTFIKDANNKDIKEVESKLTEPIEGRIMDLINYGFLLYGMVKEKKEKTNE